jgi:hypothetical protein
MEEDPLVVNFTKTTSLWMTKTMVMMMTWMVTAMNTMLKTQMMMVNKIIHLVHNFKEVLSSVVKCQWEWVVESAAQVEFPSTDNNRRLAIQSEATAVSVELVDSQEAWALWEAWQELLLLKEVLLMGWLLKEVVSLVHQLVEESVERLLVELSLVHQQLKTPIQDFSNLERFLS